MFIKHALICRWKFLQSLKESACILKKVFADFKGICMLITIYLNNAGSQRLISHSVAGQLSRWPPLEPPPLHGPSTLAMLPTRPPTKWFVWSLISGWDCRRRHRGIWGIDPPTRVKKKKTKKITSITIKICILFKILISTQQFFIISPPQPRPGSATGLTTFLRHMSIYHFLP